MMNVFILFCVRIEKECLRSSLSKWSVSNRRQNRKLHSNKIFSCWKKQVLPELPDFTNYLIDNFLNFHVKHFNFIKLIALSFDIIDGFNDLFFNSLEYMCLKAKRSKQETGKQLTKGHITFFRFETTAESWWC